MTQSTPLPIAQLRKCIALAQEVANHPQANQAFEQRQGQYSPRKSPSSRTDRFIMARSDRRAAFSRILARYE